MLHALALSLVVTLAASAQEAGSVSVIEARYTCEHGVHIEAAYLNTQPGASYAAISYAGNLVLMRQLPAASGARYADLDEQRGWRWNTRGQDAFLAFMAADDTATEIPIVEGCSAADNSTQ